MKIIIFILWTLTYIAISMAAIWLFLKIKLWFWSVRVNRKINKIRKGHKDDPATLKVLDDVKSYLNRNN